MYSYGCLGVNKVADMVKSIKEDVYTVQLARFGVRSLAGRYIHPVKKQQIDKLNENPINNCYFKMIGTDVKLRPTLADSLVNNPENICASLFDFKLHKDGASHILSGKLILVGAKASILREIIQDNAKIDGSHIFFGMRTLMEFGDNDDAKVQELLGFDYVAT